MNASSESGLWAVEISRMLELLIRREDGTLSMTWWGTGEGKYKGRRRLGDLNYDSCGRYHQFRAKREEQNGNKYIFPRSSDPPFEPRTACFVSVSRRRPVRDPVLYSPPLPTREPARSIFRDSSRRIIFFFFFSKAGSPYRLAS